MLCFERGKEILAIGRLSEQKGFDLLIDAWSKISNRLPDWFLRIVGEGEMRDKLIEQSKFLHLNHNFIISNYTNNPFQLYSSCGIFVLSSRYEGLPYVLIEAMMMGAPCVSFDCPNGPSELIQNGVNGVLVSPENVGKLAEALLEMANNRQKRIAIGDKAKGIESCFSPEIIVRSWEKIFKEK
jgi:glycosyltransferase involved in cell wall biosynthesis